MGITPHPPNIKLRKTAFTAVDTVASTHYADILEAVRVLREKGFKIIVLETTSFSRSYTEIEYSRVPTALVLGNELTGVDTRLIEQADAVVEIPTFGIKNSLNVASCASIVLYEVLRQWGIQAPREDLAPNIT